MAYTSLVSVHGNPFLLFLLAAVLPQAMFLARAIVVYAKSRGQRQTRLLCQAEDLPGFGARARVNGHEVIIGSTETLAAAGITANAVWIAVERGGNQKDEYG